MSYTLLSEAFPVARKQHVCVWCGEHILKGEKYKSEHSVYDGDMQYHKWHLECSEASLEHFKEQEEFDPYDNPRGALLDQ